MYFIINITPKEGIWKDIAVKFSCSIPSGYPHDRPRIKCISEIVHPNILGVNAEKCQGAVCLNILREDWRPIYTINTAIVGLLNLLLEPQNEEPLDKIAADLFIKDPQLLRLENMKF
ncbi:ubiquitin-conjugating enzyme family member protein [Theileria equi strain WA]|uniref:Ubiquitin-conjugating enzyme family member protein n=1 Tax=Theileria equi strain WA TaxID=1537102 RepID=L1LF78_THEEQ|nr:ubiquitin-conjugating enzyme family member protein [Theileria equi strain WA]EKX73939.1 ubiquitin-conjugating enzyme family member protein [Theileria equi strain WA]|eukprot:XP_004833391.1 ubiquitin-conjugating enzyme family member protein [Theileria equi strain WA]